MKKYFHCLCLTIALLVSANMNEALAAQGAEVEVLEKKINQFKEKIADRKNVMVPEVIWIELSGYDVEAFRRHVDKYLREKNKPIEPGYYRQVKFGRKGYRKGYISVSYEWYKYQLSKSKRFNTETKRKTKLSSVKKISDKIKNVHNITLQQLEKALREKEEKLRKLTKDCWKLVHADFAPGSRIDGCKVNRNTGHTLVHTNWSSGEGSGTIKVDWTVPLFVYVKEKRIEYKITATVTHKRHTEAQIAYISVIPRNPWAFGDKDPKKQDSFQCDQGQTLYVKGNASNASNMCHGCVGGLKPEDNKKYEQFIGSVDVMKGGWKTWKFTYLYQWQ